MKKALLLVNPASGKQAAKYEFFDIVYQLSKKYELTVHITRSTEDLVQTARPCVYPTVIVCGGDGTLSGAVKGLLDNPHREQISVGYIPCGTANDVAHTLGIPKDLVEAANYVCHNKAKKHDIGFLGDRPFVYTASFGTFTKTSYSTPQEIKNVLGGFAYLDMQGYDLTFEYEGGVFRKKDVTFCSVSNSHSIGGVIHYDMDLSTLSDGKLELLIVSRPHSLSDIEQILYALTTREFHNDLVTLIQTPWVKMHTKTPVSFTIDGENGGDYTDVDIRCHQGALNLIRK